LRIGDGHADAEGAAAKGHESGGLLGRRAAAWFRISNTLAVCFVTKTFAIAGVSGLAYRELAGREL